MSANLSFSKVSPIMLITTAVVAVAAAPTILGINPQAEAQIAIDEEGVKIDTAQALVAIDEEGVKIETLGDEDGPFLNLDSVFNELVGEPIPDIDVKLGCKGKPRCPP
jgi:hypothetical protein